MLLLIETDRDTSSNFMVICTFSLHGMYIFIFHATYVLTYVPSMYFNAFNML